MLFDFNDVTCEIKEAFDFDSIDVSDDTGINDAIKGAIQSKVANVNIRQACFVELGESKFRGFAESTYKDMPALLCKYKCSHAFVYNVGQLMTQKGWVSYYYSNYELLKRYKLAPFDNVDDFVDANWPDPRAASNRKTQLNKALAEWDDEIYKLFEETYKGMYAYYVVMSPDKSMMLINYVQDPKYYFRDTGAETYITFTGTICKDEWLDTDTASSMKEHNNKFKTGTLGELVKAVKKAGGRIPTTDFDLIKLPDGREVLGTQYTTSSKKSVSRKAFSVYSGIRDKWRSSINKKPRQEYIWVSPDGNVKYVIESDPNWYSNHICYAYYEIIKREINIRGNDIKDITKDEAEEMVSNYQYYRDNMLHLIEAIENQLPAETVKPLQNSNDYVKDLLDAFKTKYNL